ncbi:MAG: hypothetical protein KGJ13_02865 [Patescibacteria group bacterium]|nr:hypothetical protein [Patescibacteria group bacterium]
MRRAKQIIYGAFYLIILLGLFTLFYWRFLKPAPPKPCADCLPPNIQPIAAVGPIRIFMPDSGHAALLAQVANVNSNVAAASFDYTVTVYDASGTVLATAPGTAFAYPDETKFIAVPNEPVSGIPDHADMTVGNIRWVASSTSGAMPEFTVKNIVTAPIMGSSSTLAVQGDLTDDDNSAFSNILVVAIFKDQYGSPAGVSQTILDGISPQQTEHFSVSYPAAPNINLSATEVHAYAWR